MLSVILALQGCFDPVYPQLDREARIMEALNTRDQRVGPPSPLTPSEAVAYALANNLDARVAEIETAYHNESAVAARRRLLPSLTMRYSMDHSNHPSARWSESTRSGNQSLESSYSSDPNSRQGEVGMMWNVIDFGVGYFRSRQQGERIRHSEMQRRRVRQQVVLDVLSNYWRASAALTIAQEAEALKRELSEQADAIRDSVEMRILSGAEGARRELAVHGGLAELEQWRRAAAQSKLELARVMGCGNAVDFALDKFPDDMPQLPPQAKSDPSALQTAALRRRPELFQHDAQERIAIDEARIALLQMAPNANLSLSVYDDPDKFLEWSNWMTVGARVSWNLFNIPARLAERRMAKLQGETAKRKGLALAAAIMAQVGIAYSDWCLSYNYADTLAKRAAARQRLVEALAAGEKDGQTRPGEVLQERVRLLSEKAAAMRASAEARVAGARLANAIGLDVDARGQLIWALEDPAFEAPEGGTPARGEILFAEEQAQKMLPDNVSGLRLVKAEDFLTPDEYFTQPVSVNTSGTETYTQYPPAETAEWRSGPGSGEPEGGDPPMGNVASHREERAAPVAAGGGEYDPVKNFYAVDGIEGESGPDPAAEEKNTAELLRTPSSSDIWKAINESYATASPAALAPKDGGEKREKPGKTEKAENADSGRVSLRPPPGGVKPDKPDGAANEPYQAMAGPEGQGKPQSRQVPKTSFVPNALSTQTAFEDRDAEPRKRGRIPPELEARQLERRRALEPLEAISQNKPLRPPDQTPVSWPNPLDN